MVLAVHSYVVFHHESKGLSQAGYHIFLDEDEPFPQWNVPILTIFQVINFVMSSAAESELGEMFITAKELVPMLQTMIGVGWPQPPTPIQTDNSTEVGVVNDTIIVRKTNSMDLRLH